MNIFSYLRVSTTGQIDGDGFPRQRDAISAFCVNHDLTCCKEFCESASGTVEAMSRPQFAQMMDEVERRRTGGYGHQIDGIVVERIDRLARNLMVSEFLLAECRKRNLKIFSADQGALIDMAQDDGDPTRTLIRQVLGALSQWQKCEIVKKLSTARMRVRREKGRCEGVKPYGFFPTEARLKQLMMEYRHLGHSYDFIAETLNEGGFRTRKGKLWTADHVMNVHLGRKLKGYTGQSTSRRGRRREVL